MNFWLSGSEYFWSFLTQPLGGILLFLAGLLAVMLLNGRVVKRIETFPAPAELPFISVLVPARDEALNIETCTVSLLEQEYTNYEVLVLDDQSQDGTGEILARLQSENSRLTVLEGAPLPAGWVGKQWACQQLADSARGELLIFTDADTRHHPQMLHDAAAAQRATGALFISGMPKQLMGSWTERIAIPMVAFVLYGLTPLFLAHRLPFPSISAAVGQFLLFTRHGYERVGGHAAVRATSIEDLVFVRLVKSQRLPWLFLNLSSRVQTRMYRNAPETFLGISKNLFAVFSYRLIPFSFAWLWLLYVFTYPLAAGAAWLLGRSPQNYSIWLGMLAIGLSLLLWAINNWQFQMPARYAVFYPLTAGLYALMAVRSAWAFYTGQSMSWKGRQLPAEERKSRI